MNLKNTLKLIVVYLAAILCSGYRNCMVGQNCTTLIRNEFSFSAYKFPIGNFGNTTYSQKDISFLINVK